MVGTGPQTRPRKRTLSDKGTTAKDGVHPRTKAQSKPEGRLETEVAWKRKAHSSGEAATERGPPRGAGTTTSEGVP